MPGPDRTEGGLDRNGERVARLIRHHLETPVPPSEPCPAATVVLVRDGPLALETYLLTRTSSMRFAPGQTVFPGGTIDHGDETLVEDDIDSGPVASAFGCDHDSARRLMGGALREVAEETGVDLRGRRLHPWARWITPEWSPRRFDTYFFVAELPTDQVASNTSSAEAVTGAWTRPAEALAARDRGDIDLFTPTARVLEDLATADVVADLMARRPSVGATTFGYTCAAGRVEVHVDHPGRRERLLAFDL